MTCLNDLVDSVAITIDYKEDVSRAKIKRILQAAFASIEELTEYEDLRIQNFGVFYMKHSKERNSRNPKTGEAIVVPAKSKLAFRHFYKNRKK